MARILIAVPFLRDCLAPLAGHELIEGAPGIGPARRGADLLPDPARRRCDAGADAAAARDRRRGRRLRRDRPATPPRARGDRGDDRGRGRSWRRTADLAFGLIIAACRLMHDAEAHAARRRVARLALPRGARARRARRAARPRRLRRDRPRGRPARPRPSRCGVSHHTRHDTGEEGWVGDLDELLSRQRHRERPRPAHGLHARADRRTPDRPAAARTRCSSTPRAARSWTKTRSPRRSSAGRLFAAGLDVYAHEPSRRRALLAAPRTVLLPHVGSATLRRAHRDDATGAASKLAAFLAAEGAATSRAGSGGR